MDDKNIEILMKKRSEEIKKQREETSDVDINVEVNEQVTRKDNETKKEVNDTINKMQKGSLVWKVSVLVLLVAVNFLWMSNRNLKSEVEELQLEIVASLSSGDSYTYEGKAVLETDLIQVDNRVLVSVDFVISNIDKNIHYSNSGARVYVPLENMNLMLETPEVTKYVKENIVDINVPILTKNGVNYIDFSILNKLYGLDVLIGSDGSFSIFKETYKNLAFVSSKVEFIRTSDNMLNITEKEDKNLKSVVIDTYDDLSKIISEDGRIGYVKTSDIKTYNYDDVKLLLNEVREDFDYGNSLNMTWSQIYSYKSNPNLALDETIPGLDAISPTWFSLNINGIVINEADFRYVKNAQEKGYAVWGLFSNSFKPKWTSEMLNDEVYMKKTIAQIAFYAALYDLDGVNIDYENMYLEDKDRFSYFIKELSNLLKEQNVTLSIAVTVPGGSDQWSKVYDRKEIAKHVDYMMLMAYDEFWASSPVSGPVASIPWVIKGIEETLEEVPNEKLILGVPLFMRVWKESGNSVSSKAIGIKHLEDVLSDKDYSIEYDLDNMLNYISYNDEGKLHKIWLEDSDSLDKRIALTFKYKLPGIGSWSKEFVEDVTWTYINELLD